MKTSDLKAVYGTLAAIGQVFAPFNNGKPLNRWAVSQWKEAVPPLRVYQIRELVPDIDRRIASARRNGRKGRA